MVNTTTIKTAELTGNALDWAVAKCEGWKYDDKAKLKEFRMQQLSSAKHCYSTEWAHGGPIIEREGITTVFCSGDLGEPRSYWTATNEVQGWQYGYGPYHEKDDEKSIQIYRHEIYTGPSPLIATMRCYVASKLGDVAEIPNELL